MVFKCVRRMLLFYVRFGQEVNGGVLNVAEGGRVRFKSKAFMHDVKVSSVTDEGSDFSSDQWFGGCVYNKVRIFYHLQGVWSARSSRFGAETGTIEGIVCFFIYRAWVARTPVAFGAQTGAAEEGVCTQLSMCLTPP